LSFVPSASAHDAWLEVDTPVVRAGDAAQVRVMLGNHGNDHRDFKVAGKLDLSKGTLTLTSPGGSEADLKSSAIDLGLGPRDGYWMARVATEKSGVYVIAHTSSSQHGKSRSLKFAKAVVATVQSLDRPGRLDGFDVPIGHALEIIPVSDPTQAVTGEPIRVKVVHHGKPLSGARVSFIPRGTTLAAGVDPQFERMADSDGLAEWTPLEGNDVLIAVHHHAEKESGEGYEGTQYAATLVIRVTVQRN
jgi:uncharacterized GH25 family protein